MPGHPLVEDPDVMLGRHEDAAVGIPAGGHGRLAPLTGIEVLLVHAVEQLHRPGHVLTRIDHLAGESTTSRENSQSHSTIVRSSATGYIRWKIA